MSDTAADVPAEHGAVPRRERAADVFEDRYRALVHHLLRVEDPAERVFGSVGIREGYEVGDHGAQSLYRVGCRVQLTEVEAHPDGTFDVVAVGLDRIQLERLDTTGDVPGRATSSSGPTPAPTVPEEVARAGPGHLHGLPGGAGRDPQRPLPGALPRDPTYLSWTLAAVAPLPLPERQALLEAEDADRAAGPGHRPAARRAAGDERDPVAARHRGRPHPLVAQLGRRTWPGKKSAGGTPATVALTRAGIAFTAARVRTTTRGPTSYGLEAAEALGRRPGPGASRP